MEYSNTNICALATPQGTGAIGIIRLSGKDTIDIVDSVFVPVFKENNPTPIKLKVTPAYKMRFGSIFKNEALLDEVLVTVFRAPHSYTGENAVEIYCHGSNYIINEILKLLLSKGI
ncbi:MAG: tRNA uridine-5-carboxymethylaminomethyl(34) synthesis GTPase MnmE, partial [Bacteroidales bacterium]